MNIVLIGMMGSGKSVVGALLAQRVGFNFRDVDSCIENEERMTIAEIFERKGEPFFRTLEHQMIQKIAQEDRCVIATGGGAPCFEENWKNLAGNGTIIWLEVRPDQLYERMKKTDSALRPLLKNDMTLQKIESILNQRTAVYQKAHWTIQTDLLSPEETVEKIIDYLKSEDQIK